MQIHHIFSKRSVHQEAESGRGIHNIAEQIDGDPAKASINKVPLYHSFMNSKEIQLNKP